jgi:type IV pilus assembly protein PilO
MEGLKTALAPILNAPKPHKIAIGVMLLIVGGGLMYYFLLSPLQQRVAELETQNEQVQREVAQHRAMVADLERYRREANELEKRLALLQEKLPTEKEMPPLYRTMSDAAFESGLAVSLFQPREPKVRDFYNEIPISIVAEGGYHELGEFLEKVGKLPRVVTVGDMKLSGLPKQKNPMKAEVTFATYTYRPVGSPPAPKPGAAPGAK